MPSAHDDAIFSHQKLYVEKTLIQKGIRRKNLSVKLFRDGNLHNELENIHFKYFWENRNEYHLEVNIVKNFTFASTISPLSPNETAAKKREKKSKETTTNNTSITQNKNSASKDEHQDHNPSRNFVPNLKLRKTKPLPERFGRQQVIGSSEKLTALFFLLLFRVPHHHFFLAGHHLDL
ncbi:hypothetical protein TNCT_356431 [Trichonephila clavata]|uniref:Uncharacterized protein n=1 Tax=Trichonephila clavata TaxID=2740835 RepID=A0A8X6LSB9_TRICU|nr:hypothetical protein TNCT_356431 [Trichonephila clavata]